MHWNCVRAKQVVFKCSDVATFHQNLALGKVATLLMEAQRKSKARASLYLSYKKKKTQMDQVLLTVNVLLSQLCY